MVPKNGKAILNASSILPNLSPPQLFNVLMVTPRYKLINFLYALYG